MTKRLIAAIVCILISLSSLAQKDVETIYQNAAKLSETKQYAQAAKELDKIDWVVLTNGQLYNSACIYALNNEGQKAMTMLEYLVNQKYYTNHSHISTDTDLASLHAHERWDGLMEQVKKNIATQPKRTREKIIRELYKAKQILSQDNGQLWGEPIWTDDLLVLDMDNTIYALTPFPNSQPTDDGLYAYKAPAQTLGFSNSIQKYEGKDYAVVMTTYLADSSATIIHELFHVLQYKNQKLSGDAIKYLDNYDAREWLRLEYQALRNTFVAMEVGASKDSVHQLVQDALLYRKLRHTKYAAFLPKELEIETLEGLANYTGLALSTYPAKYKQAIKEINGREAAETYTRPFPYATGVAYGLIYDYLGFPWKKGLKEVYDFLQIYEAAFPDVAIRTHKKALKKANARNNFPQIHATEQERKTTNETNIAYYKKLLVKSPTLSVMLVDKQYGMSFNMNGTIVLENAGTVYSALQGRDMSGNNFGSFSTIKAKEKIGYTGILMSDGFKTIIFPTPFAIVDNKIIADTYEITLNKGWIVRKKNDKGDYEIVKQSVR